MTLSKIFLTQLTAVGTVALLAQPASAMTCVEFNALDEEQQMQAVSDMAAEAGDAVREGEPLDEAAEGTDGTVQVETEEATDSGAPRDEARSEDRGGEAITVIREECEKDPDFDMKTVNFEAPKEK